MEVIEKGSSFAPYLLLLDERFLPNNMGRVDHFCTVKAVL